MRERDPKKKKEKLKGEIMMPRRKERKGAK